MTPVLTLLVYITLLTWLALLLASLLRAKGWTLPGMLLALGNRENMPEASALAGRADRAARNTLEGFVLFAARALAAEVGPPASRWVPNCSFGHGCCTCRSTPSASPTCAPESGPCAWWVWR